jgi:hypothetical protein
VQLDNRPIVSRFQRASGDISTLHTKYVDVAEPAKPVFVINREETQTLILYDSNDPAYSATPVTQFNNPKMLAKLNQATAFEIERVSYTVQSSGGAGDVAVFAQLRFDGQDGATYVQVYHTAYPVGGGGAEADLTHKVETYIERPDEWDESIASFLGEQMTLEEISLNGKVLSASTFKFKRVAFVIKLYY